MFVCVFVFVFVFVRLCVCVCACACVCLSSQVLLPLRSPLSTLCSTGPIVNTVWLAGEQRAIDQHICHSSSNSNLTRAGEGERRLESCFGLLVARLRSASARCISNQSKAEAQASHRRQRNTPRLVRVRGRWNRMETAREEEDEEEEPTQRKSKKEEGEEERRKNTVRHGASC